MALPASFPFSQASLQDYVDCPRRFQLRYVQHVVWPAAYEPDSEWRNRAALGAAFHQLVHRHISGLPASALEANAQATDLIHWWHAYLHQPPPGLPQKIRRSEMRLTMRLGDHRLIARYDLVAIEPGERAVIVDWKTSQTHPQRAWLEQRWQTRVYQYVLVEAGTHLNANTPLIPCQVELVYWFANAPDQIERFTYNAEQHAECRAMLESLVAEIGSHRGQEWPSTEDLRQCQYCTYRTLCDRASIAGGAMETEMEDSLFDLDVDLEQIAEIAF